MTLTPRELRERQYRIALEKAVRAARTSLSAYIRLVWPLIDSAHYKHNWHVDAICEHLEAVSAGEIQYLWVNIPPGMLKSLSVSVFWPSWEWLAHPELQYQRASHDMSLATRDNIKVRDLIRHPSHVDWFGEIPLKKDQDGKTYFVNESKGSQRALSPRSSTTGHRSHRLIVDDLLDNKDAHSDVKREQSNTWFTKTFMSRRHDEARDPVVVIAQRLHENDIFGVIEDELDVEGDWVKLILPQRFDVERKCVTRIGWEDPRQEDGELLFPERVDEKQDAKNKRTLGETDYAAQQTQLPTTPGGEILHSKYIRFYELTPKEIARRCSRVVLTVDCTFKDEQSSDYVCIQVIGHDEEGYNLLDETMDKLDLPKTVEAIVAMHAEWNQIHGIEAVLVEDKANGSAVIKELRRRLTGVLAINPEGGKVVRAHAIAPVVDAGQFLLPHPNLNKQFRDPDNPGEWISSKAKRDRYGKFPKLKFDDDIDATTQGITHLRNNTWGVY